MASQFDRIRVFWLGLLAAAAFCISFFSPSSYAHADGAGYAAGCAVAGAKTARSGWTLTAGGCREIPPMRKWVNHLYWVYPVGRRFS